MKNLKRFADLLSKDASPPSLTDAVMEICESINIGKFAYLGVPIHSNCIEECVLLSNYPREWTEYYLDQKYHLLDPVVSTAMANHLPFFWGPGQEIQPETRSEKRLFKEAAEHGVQSGWTVPIHDIRGQVGSLNFSISGDFNSFQRAITKNRQELHLISIYLHSAVTNRSIEISKNRRMPRLSPREVECLQWASLGKSRNDISAILNLSPSTVKFHIENAMRKFNVSTSRQAILHASIAGMISVHP